ncbi:hypothetical protein VNO78_28512 [Psophocarpus tetragonolobus]|uniref:Cystatin domain-containing protein n=1 Tax=Psophocarpus tetragonolobus TaxID=3891 RepID=A0AAN9XDD1_PSOTE
MVILVSVLYSCACACACASACASASCARMVGGRTEIGDVRTNKEVQELGKFAVEEYNRGLKLYNENIGIGREKLKFSEVVEAQQQVVSGIKYYLKISATHRGLHRMFNSVVLVKPWLHSKQLLHFAPAPSQHS